MFRMQVIVLGLNSPKRFLDKQTIRSLLEPCTTDEFPSLATRPKDSVLNHMGLRINGFDPMPHWKNALERFLQNNGPKQKK